MTQEESQTSFMTTVPSQEDTDDTIETFHESTGKFGGSINTLTKLSYNQKRRLQKQAFHYTDFADIKQMSQP